MSGPYHRPHSAAWFLKRPAYVRFMIREMTAPFILAYLILFLVFLARLGAGQDVFLDYLRFLNQPPLLILHGLLLVGALWHSITWFNVTPRAMPMRVGERRLPDPVVAILMGYLPWAVVTVLILWATCP